MDATFRVASVRSMKCLWVSIFLAGFASAADLDEFIAKAKEAHGDAGAKAAEFLIAGMPDKDKETLRTGLLTENLDLAFKAREEFPWAKQVPDEIFLNDVLPYAVFDETREAWREDFLERARPMVAKAKSASEAAQMLNREFFKEYNVHYNTGRKRPNQSPSESKELGMATCTGLSIILVDACRAVGIPARGVGTPLWSNGRGNHTWVEIWDGEWHFAGADEYDEKGLNRGWFVNDAAEAKADVPEHAIYATSWKKDGLTFPMVWAPSSKEVAAVNVTGRYSKSEATPVKVANLGVRLVGERDGERMVAEVVVYDAMGRIVGKGATKAGRADLNDMPRFGLKPGAKGWVRFVLGDDVREISYGPLVAGDPMVDVVWSELPKLSASVAEFEGWLKSPGKDPKSKALTRPLGKLEAQRIAADLAAAELGKLVDERKVEFENKEITIGDKKLRWLEKSFGAEPEDGRSLWISMHGGGGAPPQVNDQQWQNQIGLYEPKEGIYIAPRAPTNTWNLWHQSHIDPLFQRLIEDCIAFRGVNPNKVYIMGYSAGGDGVWQLAPRMADRFAAAAMMAGHPNEASLLGLRNLPFAIFMGGADSAYDRNKIAAAKSEEMDQLEKDDPGGYVHMSRIYEGLPHWMNGKDAEALPWMEKFTRDPWPKKVVWLQDDVTHDRFYWLKIPDKGAVKAGEKIVATVEGQTIRLEGDVPAGLELRLSDELLELNLPVTVIVNGKEVASKMVARTAAVVRRSLEERFDLPAAATAVMVLP